MKVLVLLSGGLDSTVVLATCMQEHECSSVGFDYGQKHLIELDRAAQIAKWYKVPFRRIALGSMPLIDDVVFAGRNLVMAATAIAIAQAEGQDAVALGCNESDWARFPDCRPPFWSAVRTAAESYGISVITPLLHVWKGVVVEQARTLGVPIELTWSCYSPRGDEPCGECLACRTRNEACGLSQAIS